MYSNYFRNSFENSLGNSFEKSWSIFLKPFSIFLAIVLELSICSIKTFELFEHYFKSLPICLKHIFIVCFSWKSCKDSFDNFLENLYNNFHGHSVGISMENLKNSFPEIILGVFFLWQFLQGEAGCILSYFGFWLYIKQRNSVFKSVSAHI